MAKAQGVRVRCDFWHLLCISCTISTSIAFPSFFNIQDLPGNPKAIMGFADLLSDAGLTSELLKKTESAQLLMSYPVLNNWLKSRSYILGYVHFLLLSAGTVTR